MTFLGFDERWAAYLTVAEMSLGGAARVHGGRIAAVHRGAVEVLRVDEAGAPDEVPDGAAHGAPDGAPLRIDLDIPGHCRDSESWPPMVGDWVGVDDAGHILDILPRRTYLTRPSVGRAALEQPICANIDVVLIVEPAVPAASRGRIERFVALAHASGARPWLVLTKADLANPADLQELGEGCEEVLALDARSAVDVARLVELLSGTVVVVGRSGAGKSTLTNTLLGATQTVGTVRESDHKGRHTTTGRQLVCGEHFAVIDTPGVRALGATMDTEAIADTFADIRELAASCHFANCSHGREPRCAVREACASGALDVDRLDRYLRMMAEAERLRSRSDARTARSQDRHASKENTRGRRETMRLKGKNRG
ncbi:ribosome small subunit-dependent GTPase A [Actinotignum sp. GS-2025c]|uniref:ribosome small subunit-dependent GTPase A n=1 Tax=Actinotignum TaxID=1653174 RepID=UPI00254E2F33|nr:MULTISPECIES: ribosome small subunit-dependent GTPase A [Actinotignum]MDE1535744.1 ribosome small subunit-dependent GTPase A [Actinotignum schaalii]MDK6927110.1 ribosome small subunit-dependent GTPase A [Actinotignum timonense]